MCLCVSGGQLGNTGSSCEERELVRVWYAVPGVFLSCFEGADAVSRCKVTQPLIPSANICSVLLLARPWAKGWEHKGGRGPVFALELLTVGQCGQRPTDSEAGAGPGRTQGLQGWGERWLGEGSRWLGEGSQPASEDELNCMGK